MASEIDKSVDLFTSETRSATIPRTAASVVFALGLVFGISGFIIWPVSLIQGWNSDAMITILFFSAFFLMMIACHLFDRIDKRKRPTGKKSL